MGIGRNSLKVYLSYFDGFPWRIFPLLRANRLYVIFSTGLKKWLLLVRATFRLPLPGVLALAAPHLFTTISVQRLIFLFPISADGRSSHFRLRVLANHLASLFFPLVRRFIRATICHPISHSLSIRSPSTNTCFSILTWICYFGIDLHYLS